MLRLGHIDYSNCVPVHALVLERTPEWLLVRRGVPSELNRALAAREIDVAPCSSIEYARHGDYRLLPDVVIGARGAVESILLESRRPMRDLDGAVLALPSASATSVVLLRALLEISCGVRPRYVWFDQHEADAIPAGADAALWIGDVALARRAEAGTEVTDLGTAWAEWTGLPFAFALWQTSAPSAADPELSMLHRLLLESLDVFRNAPAELARRHAGALGIEPERLARYWRGLNYELDDATVRGVRHFFELAVQLGETPAAPPMRWVPVERSVSVRRR